MELCLKRGVWRTAGFTHLVCRLIAAPKGARGLAGGGATIYITFSNSKAIGHDDREKGSKWKYVIRSSTMR